MLLGKSGTWGLFPDKPMTSSRGAPEPGLGTPLEMGMKFSVRVYTSIMMIRQSLKNPS